MNDLLADLGRPFSPEAVEWRLGTLKADKTKGMALAYIDARAVQDRLDEVCGANWMCEHTVSATGTKVTCRIGIKIDGEWVWRSDGAGETDVEAEKGSYSDSFKRAAVKWRIGRYLYDLSSPWVDIEPMGKSHRIKDSEHAKLRAVLSRVATVGSVAQSLDPKVVETWRKEVQACASADDLDRLKRTPEFKAAWSKMSVPDRDKVQQLFSTAASAFLSRKQAA